jgi:hypothetical protein
MGIAERSARWANLALYFVGKGDDSLVKSDGICPRIDTSLNSPPKKLKLVRLSRVKTETTQPEKPGIKWTVWRSVSVPLRPTDNCVFVITADRQSTSSKEMATRILFLAANKNFSSPKKSAMMIEAPKEKIQEERLSSRSPYPR